MPAGRGIRLSSDEIPGAWLDLTQTGAALGFGQACSSDAMYDRFSPKRMSPRLDHLADRLIARNAL
jgi:hypothetical protein